MLQQLVDEVRSNISKQRSILKILLEASTVLTESQLLELKLAIQWNEVEKIRKLLRQKEEKEELTVRQLREKAKELWIKNYCYMSKAMLLTEIERKEKREQAGTGS